MKKALGLGLGIALPFLLFAQQDTSLTTGKNLDEVIIYSNKFAERKKNIVQKVEVVNAAQIAQINAQNIGDLLIQTGNVFVQKSQQGGSSPFCRGFEASHILLMIDDVRINDHKYPRRLFEHLIDLD